ncbi:MAG: hypothetical protein MR654_04345 [Corynebacterium glucuronolyticum]|nr:hypothetical protein [Corynebacterium glucuronolyticum]
MTSTRRELADQMMKELLLTNWYVLDAVLKVSELLIRNDFVDEGFDYAVRYEKALSEVSGPDLMPEGEVFRRLSRALGSKGYSHKLIPLLQDFVERLLRSDARADDSVIEFGDLLADLLSKDDRQKEAEEIRQKLKTLYGDRGSDPRYRRRY